MGLELFVGAWTLVSTEHRRSDGQIVFPFGKHPAGLIMYDTEGYMSVHIAGADRPKFASGSRLEGTPEEIKIAFETYLAYWGTYEILEKEQTVIHHIEGGLIPNDAGRDNRRRYELNGDQLKLLTTPTVMRGEQVTGMLLWRRAKPIR